jgi:succinate dehydrogenase / fumarate reductase, iron-sulfur subunit
MEKLSFHLLIWRQSDANTPGKMVSYHVQDISPDLSFLEMLDVLNEELSISGENPIQFDSDCREGICGTCGLVINGVPHGGQQQTSTCQLYMRHFQDGETMTIEPFRARSFPIIKDLVVDRSAFDRIVATGGYVSVAECIACGACVAGCPNASASLFVAAKIAQYTFLPQGQPERSRRAIAMVGKMDAEGFGNCSNHGICGTICPKEISIEAIAKMRREYIRAAWDFR